jgi:hypothetical protein
MSNCVMENNHAAGNGGALSISAGQLVASNTDFTANSAAGGGGAVVTKGGVADFSSCIFWGNQAATTGGALLALNGTVILRDATLLANNEAVDGGDAMFIVSAKVEYYLPAPLGRWILSESGSCGNETAGDADTPRATIPKGATNEYPYPCAPGLFGETDDEASQSGPQCSGLCTCSPISPLNSVVGMHSTSQTDLHLCCPSQALQGTSAQQRHIRPPCARQGRTVLQAVRAPFPALPEHTRMHPESAARTSVCYAPWDHRACLERHGRPSAHRRPMLKLKGWISVKAVRQAHSSHCLEHQHVSFARRAAIALLVPLLPCHAHRGRVRTRLSL